MMVDGLHYGSQLARLTPYNYGPNWLFRFFARCDHTPKMAHQLLDVAASSWGI
jgi:hypothetical protein